MFFSVLVATRLPSRSFGPWIGLSPLTTMPPKSAVGDSGGVVAVADHLDRKATVLSEQEGDDVAEAELVLVADDGRDDRRSALGQLEIQLDVAFGEEALFLAEIDRRHIDDRDDADDYLVWLAGGGSAAGIVRGAARGGREEGRPGEECRDSACHGDSIT